MTKIQVLYSALCLLALLCVIAGLEYLDLWFLYGIPHSEKMFLDFHALGAAAECQRAGYDTFVTNPCDVLGRPHVYPHFWFLLSDIGINGDNYTYLAFLLCVCFLITYLLVLKPSNTFELLVCSLVLISPAIILGIERGNNDLMVFVLLSLACCLLTSGDALKRGSALALILISGCLKLYPFAAVTIYLRPQISNKQFWFVVIVTSCVALSLYLTIAGDLKFSNLPRPENRWTFGAKFLFMIPFPEWPYARLSVGLAFIVGTIIIFNTKADSTLGTNLSERNILFFILGTTISISTFISNTNYDYRCIFLILCLPLLFELVRTPSQKNQYLLIITFLVLILYWEFFVELLLSFSGSDYATAGPEVHAFRWLEHAITFLLLFKLFTITTVLVKGNLMDRLGFVNSFSNKN